MVYLLLYEKNKSIKFQKVRVKSEIVVFASQRIIEFTQFLTRPNLACSVAKTDCRFFSVLMFYEFKPFHIKTDSLRSWRDFARESFCFGSKAVNESGEAARGLVKSPVEFPPAQIRGVF